MKENPLISVIIPVYNSEKYLEECVQHGSLGDKRNSDTKILWENIKKNYTTFLKIYNEKGLNNEIVYGYIKQRLETAAKNLGELPL